MLKAQRPSIVLLSLLLAGGCQRSEPTVPAPLLHQPLSSPPSHPKFVVLDTNLDMGEADYGQTRTRSVRIANRGTAPLRVTLLEKSCHCGEVEVPAEAIPPGGADKVTIKWTPTPGLTGTFTLALKLATNDPDVPQYRLELTGRISPLIRVLPEDRSALDFQTVEPGKSVERAIKLISTRLKSFDLEVNTTLPGLQADAAKLPPASEGEQYQSGYTVRVRTTPQLPSGYFRDRLALKVRVPEGESWTIELPIIGEVENGVFQVRPRAVAFQKKSVAAGDTKLIHVQFFVPSKDEALQVARCEPSFLECDPPKQIRPGLWEVRVRLPAGNAAAAQYQPDGFFEGRILLRTPQSKTLVPVRVTWTATESN